MKTTYTLLVFLSALAFIACKKDTLSHSADYFRSYSAWKAFKDSSHNSYRYRVTNGSWTGHGSETTITVRSGKVVGRSFLLKLAQHNGTTVVTTILQEWTETEAQLGSHEAAPAPVTLDMIYEKAKQDWLKKRDDATTFFEANNRGMISLCGYVPNGCQDDCLVGISIAFIEGI